MVDLDSAKNLYFWGMMKRPRRFVASNSVYNMVDNALARLVCVCAYASVTFSTSLEVLGTGGKWGS